MKGSLPLLFVLSLSVLACGQERKEAWHESGQSWGQSGRQFLRALGRSISGEGSPKEEWKAMGRDTAEAGKDTADAVGTSIKPDEKPATQQEKK
jgi:hypothetical protein